MPSSSATARASLSPAPPEHPADAAMSDAKDVRRTLVVTEDEGRDENQNPVVAQLHAETPQETVAGTETALADTDTESESESESGEGEERGRTPESESRKNQPKLTCEIPTRKEPRKSSAEKRWTSWGIFCVAFAWGLSFLAACALIVDVRRLQSQVTEREELLLNLHHKIAYGLLDSTDGDRLVGEQDGHRDQAGDRDLIEAGKFDSNLSLKERNSEPVVQKLERAGRLLHALLRRFTVKKTLMEDSFTELDKAADKVRFIHDGIKSGAKKVWDLVGDVGNGAMQVGGKAVDAAGQAVKGVADGAQYVADKAVGGLKQAANGAKQVAGGAGHAAMDGAKAGAQVVQQGVGAAVNGAAGVAKAGAGAAVDGGKAVVKAAKGLLRVVRRAASFGEEDSLTTKPRYDVAPQLAQPLPQLAQQDAAVPEKQDGSVDPSANVPDQGKISLGNVVQQVTNVVIPKQVQDLVGKVVGLHGQVVEIRKLTNAAHDKCSDGLEKFEEGVEKFRTEVVAPLKAFSFYTQQKDAEKDTKASSGGRPRNRFLRQTEDSDSNQSKGSLADTVVGMLFGGGKYQLKPEVVGVAVVLQAKHGFGQIRREEDARRSTEEVNRVLSGLRANVTSHMEALERWGLSLAAKKFLEMVKDGKIPSSHLDKPWSLVERVATDADAAAGDGDTGASTTRGWTHITVQEGEGEGEGAPQKSVTYRVKSLPEALTTVDTWAQTEIFDKFERHAERIPASFKHVELGGVENLLPFGWLAPLKAANEGLKALDELKVRESLLGDLDGIRADVKALTDMHGELRALVHQWLFSFVDSQMSQSGDDAGGGGAADADADARADVRLASEHNLRLLQDVLELAVLNARDELFVAHHDVESESGNGKSGKPEIDMDRLSDVGYVYNNLDLYARIHPSVRAFTDGLLHQFVYLLGLLLIAVFVGPCVSCCGCCCCRRKFVARRPTVRKHFRVRRSAGVTRVEEEQPLCVADGGLNAAVA